MKKFKFRKFVSKIMFTSLLVCLPFGLLVDRVQAGSGSSCVAKNPEPEPLIEPDPDGWFSFDGDNVRHECRSLEMNKNHDIVFKVRFTGDVPEGAFHYIQPNRAEFFLLNTTSIGDFAFKEFWNLLSVTLPDGLKTIGREAFIETAISSINLPSSLEHLGDLAFAATNLTDVTIPGGIKNLDSYALFACCSKLRNIKLENGIRRIGANVFGDSDCWSNAKLSGDRMNKRITLEIPDSVVELDDRFCCDIDGNNTAIETIKWNGQEFSECNWNYDIGLERFLDAFEAKSGNTLLRHRNKFERDSSGGGKRPVLYDCVTQHIITAGSHYYSLKDKAKHEKVTAAIWFDRDGDYRYYYVTDPEMESYDSIPDAISAGVDMSRIMYGEDGPVVDLAKAIKKLKKENRGPRYRNHH